MVLLVIDTQKLITNEKLYEFDKFVFNVKEIINKARQNNIEVIYVRHDDGMDSDLTKGTDGFEIYEEFRPINGEKIFDNKFMSSENSYKYYNEFIWKGRYAECISLGEVIEIMNK